MVGNLGKPEKLFMDHSAESTSGSIGFLTVIRHARHGLFGGYLVLNRAGRPLEFHCTAPVKPSRAQEILYGPTLEPYLYGEQIGSTLIRQANGEPLFLCTDVAPALEVAKHVDFPVVLVDTRTNDTPEGPTSVSNDAAEPDSAVIRRLDEAHGSPPALAWFRIGPNRLGMIARRETDRGSFEERLGKVAAQLDLSEPFERIREAIEEAQRGRHG